MVSLGGICSATIGWPDYNFVTGKADAALA